MLEQVSTSVKFLAFFTASKQGKTGLTVTIDIYDPSGSKIVDNQSATAIGGGLYAYTLSTNNSAEGEYAAIFKTSDSTVDAQHIPSLWVLGRAGVENLDASVSSRSTLTAAQVNTEADTALADVGLTTTITGRIDQAISSRLAAADYTAPTAAPSVVDIRTELERTGGKLDSIPTTSAPSASTVAGAVRSELGTELGRIDAAISSRLASADYTAPTAAPTAAQNASAVRTELSVELARIDAPISGATAPSAATVASAVRTELSTELGRVDAAVSTRLASTAATDLAAVKAKTDALNTERLANVPTVNILGTLLAQANS